MFEINLGWMVYGHYSWATDTTMVLLLDNFTFSYHLGDCVCVLQLLSACYAMVQSQVVCTIEHRENTRATDTTEKNGIEMVTKTDGNCANAKYMDVPWL